MTYEQITYETRGAVALITLARPDKLNAWTPRMGMEQANAIARANADPAVGVIVMTGAGRGFCAGADMEATFKSRIEGTDRRAARRIRSAHAQARRTLSAAGDGREHAGAAAVGGTAHDRRSEE